MSTLYERSLAKAHKVEIFFVVEGCSWKGRTTKRDGQTVTCGHKHKTRGGCKACQKKMRKQRPGNCQDYRPAEIHLLHIKK